MLHPSNAATAPTRRAEEDGEAPQGVQTPQNPGEGQVFLSESCVKVGTLRGARVSLGGFPHCLPCRHAGETFECSPVCSAGILIPFLLFICRGCWKSQKDQNFSGCRWKEVAALASSTSFPWTQLSILMTGKDKGALWWSGVTVLCKNGRRRMCEMMVSCSERKKPVR